MLSKFRSKLHSLCFLVQKVFRAYMYPRSLGQWIEKKSGVIVHEALRLKHGLRRLMLLVFVV